MPILSVARKQIIWVAVVYLSAGVAGCEKERHMTVTATAFNSTRAQTDSQPNKAACGDKIGPGSKVVAVSRDLAAAGLVCGTTIQISGLEGSWTVVDRTAARHKNRIDIYMGRDIKAAREWGVQDVEIIWKD